MADSKVLTYTRTIDYDFHHERIVEREPFKASDGLKGFREAYDAAKDRVDAKTEAWFDKNIP